MFRPGRSLSFQNSKELPCFQSVVWLSVKLWTPPILGNCFDLWIAFHFKMFHAMLRAWWPMAQCRAWHSTLKNRTMPEHGMVTHDIMPEHGMVTHGTMPEHGMVTNGTSHSQTNLTTINANDASVFYFLFSHPSQKASLRTDKFTESLFLWHQSTFNQFHLPKQTPNEKLFSHHASFATSTAQKFGILALHLQKFPHPHLCWQVWIKKWQCHSDLAQKDGEWLVNIWTKRTVAIWRNTWIQSMKIRTWSKQHILRLGNKHLSYDLEAFRKRKRTLIVELTLLTEIRLEINVCKLKTINLLGPFDSKGIWFYMSKFPENISCPPPIKDSIFTPRGTAPELGCIIANDNGFFEKKGAGEFVSVTRDLDRSQKQIPTLLSDQGTAISLCQGLFASPLPTLANARCKM